MHLIFANVGILDSTKSHCSEFVKSSLVQRSLDRRQERHMMIYVEREKERRDNAIAQR